MFIGCRQQYRTGMAQHDDSAIATVYALERRMCAAEPQEHALRHGVYRGVSAEGAADAAHDGHSAVDKGVWWLCFDSRRRFDIGLSVQSRSRYNQRVHDPSHDVDSKCAAALDRGIVSEATDACGLYA